MSMQDGALKVDLPQASFRLLESDVKTLVFYRVIAPDGRTAEGHDDLPLPRAFEAGDARPSRYASEYAGRPVHFVALRRRMEDASAAAPATVIVGQTGEARDALMHTLFARELLRQGLLVVAAGLLLWLALSRSLSSLARLREKLVKRPSTDLSAIDSADVQSEVRPLIDALNLHTDRLSKVLQSREQFIADASHQMRTPLAEMRTQIDYGLLHGDTEHVRNTLTDVHGGLDALARLIGQMLLLARSDPDAIDDQRTRGVDLGDLAKTMALEHVPAARSRNIDLRFEHSAGRVFVLGNEMLLREMIANVLDNAIRHGAEGGTVTLRVVGYPKATLEVEDDGVGIDADERERVFERFYRGRSARASGSGLGLAIARNICAAHRASIELLPSAPEGGLLVCVRFTPQYQIEDTDIQ
jgi:two-component system sensor histidine kinase TctE